MTAAILENPRWPPSKVKSSLPPHLQLMLTVCTSTPRDFRFSSQSAQYFCLSALLLRVSPQGMYIIFVFTEVVTTIMLRMMKSLVQSGYKTVLCFLPIAYSLEKATIVYFKTRGHLFLKISRFILGVEQPYFACPSERICPNWGFNSGFCSSAVKKFFKKSLLKFAFYVN